MELAANKIEKIENLEELTNVEDLVLAKNRIKKIENLDNFSKLYSLNMSVLFII